MTMLVLTPLGRQVAENVSSPEGPSFDVLAVLYENNGPVDFEEILAATNMDSVRGSMVVRSLMNKGLVREVT